MWWSLLPAFAGSVDAPVHTGQVSEADYAVVIGVEDYAFLPDVPHARADAQAVRTWLESSRGVPAHRVELLTDASKEQIDAALGRARQEVGAGGTLWVYWAGHGAAAPDGGGRLLLGVDTMADPEVFAARALSVDALEASLGDVPSAVLWLDTCYAGTGRNGEALLPGTRFAVPTYTQQAPGGVLRWTAAKPGQLSTVHPSGHGAFTWASLRALQGEADGALDGARDGTVTAEEAHSFVGRALAEAGIRSQTPTLEGQGATVLVSGLPEPVAQAPAVVPMPRPVMETLGPQFPPPSAETPPRRTGLLVGLGAGAAAALTTAVVTRQLYVSAPPEDGDLQGLVVANQVAGWSGIGLGTGFLVIGTQTLLEAEMTRLRIAPMALLAGCIFITQADREARQAADDDTGVGPSTDDDDAGDDDDDVWGDDDDDNAPEGWVPGTWRAVSVGLEASCAIDDQFDLQCWSTIDDPAVDWFPAIPNDLDFVGVSMGLRGGCAWNDDGVTRCFGSPTGSQYEPVRAYLDQPGTYDKVTCGSGVCCGLGSDASFTCWDDALIPDGDWNLLDNHTDGVTDIAGTSDWCVIDTHEDTLDCFTRGSTGGEEPAWAQARFTSLHASWGNHVCAVAQENEVGCWLVSSSAGGGLSVMDAPPASELKDLHAFSNAQVPNICGLRAGVFQCFAPEFQSAYEPETPAGSWNKLSLGVGGGCLLDVEERMACWGEGGHLPHNAR